MDNDEGKLSDDQLTAGGQEKALREAKRTKIALVSIVQDDKLFLLILSDFIKDKKAREEFYREIENYYNNLKGINEAIYDYPATQSNKINYSVLEEKLMALLERIKKEIKTLDKHIAILSRELQENLIVKGDLEEKTKIFSTYAFSTEANYDLYHSSNISEQLSLDEFRDLGKKFIDQAINQAGMGKTLKEILHSQLQEQSVSSKELGKVDTMELADLLASHVKVQNGYSDYRHHISEYVNVKKTIEEKEIEISILSEKRGALAGFFCSVVDISPSLASKFSPGFMGGLQATSMELSDYRNSMEVERNIDGIDSFETVTREDISSLNNIFTDKKALEQGIKHYDDPFMDDLPLRAEKIAKADSDHDLTELIKSKSTAIHYDDPFSDETPEQKTSNDDDFNIRRLGR